MRRNGKNIKLAENLIPEFERCVSEARPEWFLMENVPDAPMPDIAGYRICNRAIVDVWVGGVTSRHRRFSFGVAEGTNLYGLARFEIETLVLHSPNPLPAVTAASGGRSPRYHGERKMKRRYRGGEIYKRLSREEICLRQGLPEDFMKASPLTVEGLQRMVGNGVPLAMGRAVAQAVKRALADPVERVT